MSEWREVTWSDLGELFDGPHATPTRTTEGPYFLNISSLSNGRLDLGQSDHVADVDFTKWTKRVTPVEDDLLFSYETRLGEAALMPRATTACLGRRMALLRPRQDLVDPRFLLYLYLSPSFQRIIDQYTIHGATVNRISLSTMGSWRLAVPDLSTQQAIAEVLGALDDKIAANTKLVQASEELTVGLLTPYEPSVELSDVVCHRKKSVAPDSLENPRVSHYSLPAFDQTHLPEDIAPREIKSSKYEIDAPAVLVSKLNPRFPRIWDIPVLPGRKALTSTEFLVLEPTRSSTTVLWAMLAQPRFGSSLESMVAGTSGSHQRAKPSEILTIMVPNPAALSEQLMDVVTSLGKAVANSRIENASLAATRDALLPHLMSGKLRVKDAEAVVAAAV